MREVLTATHPTVRSTLSLPALHRRFASNRTHGMAVVDDGRLVGVVTLADLARADRLLADGVRPPESITVADLMTSDVVTATPDDEVFRALRRMASLDIGRVPVVDDHGRYRGMLRRGDVVEAYRLALGRGQSEQGADDRATWPSGWPLAFRLKPLYQPRTISCGGPVGRPSRKGMPISL